MNPTGLVHFGYLIWHTSAPGRTFWSKEPLADWESNAGFRQTPCYYMTSEAIEADPHG